MTIRVLPEAEEEALEARARCEGQRAGLGDEFQRGLEQLFQSIGTNPRLYPVLGGGVGRRSFRAVLLDRFPYMVVYEILPGEVTVVAIAHVRKKPFYWVRRK